MSIIDMSLYASTQDALDSITQDTTNGDVLQYPDGWYETLSATLDLTAYGVPGYREPLEFRALGDATIDGGGSHSIFVQPPTSSDGVRFIGMNLGNCGSSDVIYMPNIRFSTVYGCKIYGSSGAGLVVDNETAITNCWFDDLGIGCGSGKVHSCLFTNGINHSFTFATGAGVVSRSCFYLSGASDGIRGAVSLVQCSFFTTGSGRAAYNMRPIRVYGVYGSLFEGFTKAIELSNTHETQCGPISDNAFFDCGTNYTIANNGPIVNIGNETLASSPFTKSGTIASFADRLNYFANNDVGNVRGYLAGLDKGAVQSPGGGDPAVYWQGLRRGILKGIK